MGTPVRWSGSASPTRSFGSLSPTGRVPAHQSAGKSPVFTPVGASPYVRRSWQEKCEQSRTIFHGLLESDPAAEAEVEVAHLAAQRAKDQVKVAATLAASAFAFHGPDDGVVLPPLDNTASVGPPARPPAREFEYQRIARGAEDRERFHRSARSISPVCRQAFRPANFSGAPPPHSGLEHPAPVAARPAQRAASPSSRPNRLVPVSLSQSLAKELCDTRQLPLVAGNSFGAWQVRLSYPCPSQFDEGRVSIYLQCIWGQQCTRRTCVLFADSGGVLLAAGPCIRPGARDLDALGRRPETGPQRTAGPATRHGNHVPRVRDGAGAFARFSLPSHEL
jgi:hypothetical protein